MKKRPEEASDILTKKQYSDNKQRLTYQVYKKIQIVSDNTNSEINKKEKSDTVIRPIFKKENRTLQKSFKSHVFMRKTIFFL